MYIYTQIDTLYMYVHIGSCGFLFLPMVFEVPMPSRAFFVKAGHAPVLG